MPTALELLQRTAPAPMPTVRPPITAGTLVGIPPGALGPEPPRAGTLGNVLDALSFFERHVGVPLARGAIAPFVSEATRETLQRARDGSEIVSSLFPLPDDAGFLRKAVQVAGGFAASVALDPISYVSVGGLTKLGRAAKGGGTLAATAAEQAAKGQRALVQVGVPFRGAGTPLIQAPGAFDAFEKVRQATRTSAVGRLFSAVPVNDDLAKLVREFRDLRQYRTTQEILKLKAFRDEITAVADQVGLSVDEVSDLVRNGVEVPLHVSIADLPKGLTVAQERLPARLREALETGQVTSTRALTEATRKQLEAIPEARPLVEALRRMNDTQLATEQLLKTGTHELLDDVNYFIHTLSQEARDRLTVVFGKPPREWTEAHVAAVQRAIGSPAHPSQTTRTLRGLTVSQVNEMARKGYLRIQGTPVQVDRFFETDVVKAQLVRSVRHIKSVTNAEFLSQAKKFGLSAADAPAHYVPTGMEAFGDLRFDPEVARSLMQRARLFDAPEEFTRIVDVFDGVQNLWKGWTLAIFPMYHTRNAVSNVWNNALAGVVDPRDYGRAMALQTHGADVSRHLVPLMEDGLTVLSGQTVPWKQVLDEALSRGVLGQGWYGGDLPVFMREVVQRPSRLSRTVGRDNPLLQVGMRVGTAIENNARLAHFIGRLRLGDTAEEAALSVKKYLFDYSELSEFERRVMKRIFPFYTWTRKNLPLQLEMFVREPRRFAGVEKGRQAVESIHEDGPNEKYMSDWFQKNYPVRVRKNDRGQWEYFMLGGWLPAADLEKLVRPMDVGGKFVLTSLTPFVTLPYELITNHNIMFDEPIERYPGQRTELHTPVGTVVLPALVDHAARRLRVLNEMDKAFDARKPVSTRLASLVTGRLYPYDERQARAFYHRDIQHQITSIKTDLRRAVVQSKSDALRQQLLRLLRETQSAEALIP